jgi:hypothetical protein
MRKNALNRLKSFARLTFLPLLILALVFALGRGLAGIFNEGTVAAPSQPVHTNARIATFGTRPALPD